MVDPAIMCRQHLLGEHKEIHMLVGSIRKGKSLNGYLERGLIEPQGIEKRHEEIVREMLARGYNHKSPLGEISEDTPRGFVPRFDSELELIMRCKKCRQRCRDSVNETYEKGNWG
jgi:hypothetical protein